MLRVLAQRTAPQLARSAVRTTALRGFATFGAVPKKSRFIARYAGAPTAHTSFVVRRMTDGRRRPPARQNRWLQTIHNHTASETLQAKNSRLPTGRERRHGRKIR